MGRKFYIQWDITDKCNLHCKHCYKNNKDIHVEMEKNDLLKVCDILQNIAYKNNLELSISITGGEPLSRKSDMISIFKYLQEKDNVKSIQILTNGLLIDEETINVLINAGKFNGLQVSLEAPIGTIHDEIRGEGSFEKTISSIKRIKEYGIKLYVMMTVSKLNYMYIEKMCSLLQSLKVDVFGIDRYIPQSKKDESYAIDSKIYKECCETMFKLSKNNYSMKISINRPIYCLLSDEKIGGACSAGKASISILPNGDIVPCRRLPIIVGNILEDNFENIWNDNEVLKKIRDIDNYNGKCSKCKNRKICGGCRAYAYAVNNDYIGEDSLCWM